MSQKMMERAESLAVRASRRMFLDWLAGWGALGAAGLAALLTPQPAEAGVMRCCKYFTVCGDYRTLCGVVCQKPGNSTGGCPAWLGCLNCHNALVQTCASCA